MQTITFVAVLVRVLVALLTRTFFQPDEFFQALEPAHHAVFGYGELTWEWSSAHPIRSIIYPALNIPVYWFLKVTGLHTVDAILVRSSRANQRNGSLTRSADCSPEIPSWGVRVRHRHCRR